MADGEVKKIATRESYGNALAELGQKNPNVVVLDAVSQAQQRLPHSRRNSRTVISTAVSQRLT